MPRNTRWLHVLTALIIVLVAFGARQPNAYAADAVVTTTADSGPGSLRAAITAANIGGGTIRFNLGPADPNYDATDVNDIPTETWTIKPLSELPIIGSNITIDGTTQSGNQFGPSVFIDGSLLEASSVSSDIRGLRINGSNNNIKRIGVINVKHSNSLGIGIEINGSNNTVAGVWIGVGRDGTTAAGNTTAGILINGSNNVIGTPNVNTDERNIIGRNNTDGIQIKSGEENIIQGNFIGITPRSSSNPAIPNGRHGIYIEGSTNNRIGSPEDQSAFNISYGNVISGNTFSGIYIKQSINNKIYGNYIGLGINGLTKVANGQSGIFIDASENTASGTQIGGIGAGSYNIISGNTGTGITLSGQGVTDTEIRYNYIGVNKDRSHTNAATTTNVGNGSYGVLVTNGANTNIIGSSDENQGNLIAGNGADGIRITGGTHAAGAYENRVFGNTIGIGYNASGPISLPNTGAGVFVANKVYDTTIGGEEESERNLIANHPQNGITIDATTGAVITTTLYLNRIYENTGNGVEIKGAKNTNIYGTDVLSNTISGFAVQDAYDTLISGTEPDRPILVTGNTSHGISATNAHTMTVRFISTAPGEFSVKGNGGDGVHVSNSEWFTIFRSTVENNKGAGANLDSVNHFAIEGEIIPGSPDIEHRNLFGRNDKEGILLSNVISGTMLANEITNNLDDGINITNGSDDVSIYRNIVRENGPQNDGSSIDCSANQRANDGQGIAVRDSSKHVKILRSLFGGNCGLGILRDPNDDSAGSANEGIQPPALIGFDEQRQLRGKIILTGPGKCEECIVEIFRSRDTLTVPDGEGGHKQNSGVDTITTFDEEGNFSFTLNRVPLQILATATDKYGNTSEFSTYTVTRTVDIEAAQNVVDAFPSQEIVFSQTATNTGTFDDTFALSFNSKLGLTSSNVRFSPSNSLSLLAGESKPFTVTVTLPTGSDPRVAAGKIEELGITLASTSYITASDVLTHTISITSSVAIAVTPANITGEVRAGQEFKHFFTVTNNGNIQATVNLSQVTTPAWDSTLDTSTLTLAPGASRQVMISVTPPGAALAGNQAVSTLSIDVVGNPSQNKTATATTRVVVTPRAVFYPDNPQGSASAGQTISYLHSVENRSNGTVSFQLRATSSLGSSIRFVSNTSGITIDNDGNFTLTNLTGGDLLSLEVQVTLAADAPPGGIDTVTIQLIETSTGTVIGSVQDKTLVAGSTGGAGNTIYLPFVAK